MNRFHRLEDYFVDPHGNNLEQAKKFLQSVLFMALDHAGSASTRPPTPKQDNRQELGDLFPVRGRSASDIESALSDLIQNSANPASPGWLGHMNSMSSIASIAGDIVAASIDNNMLSYEMAPVLTELELAYAKQFARSFGLSSDAGGFLVGGGTIANIQALMLAREDARRRTVGLSAQRMVVLASELAHVSIAKAVKVLGLGENGLISLPTDKSGRLCGATVLTALQQLEDENVQPICLVATAGTTSIGSIDPISEIASIARKRGIWLHVDGAYGAAAHFSKAHEGKLAGIELADSITFNPHKWFFVARNCAFLLLNNFGRLEDIFRIPLPYVRAGKTSNIGEYSIHGTQHADVIKLFVTLQMMGQEGIEALIDYGFERARRVRNVVRSIPILELLPNEDLNFVLFKFRLLTENQNTAILEKASLMLGLEDNIHMTLQKFKGETWGRLIPMSPFVKDAVLDRAIRKIQRVVS